MSDTCWQCEGCRATEIYDASFYPEGWDERNTIDGAIVLCPDCLNDFDYHDPYQYVPGGIE